MNIYNQNNYSSLPNSIIYQPSCLTSMPMSAETDDSWGNGGSGIGAGSEAIRAALGEYFERRHFYMEVMPDKTGNLGFSMSEAESKDFCKALHQTCEGNKLLDDIWNHKFQLSEVYRASDLSQCHVPTACISLSRHKIENDSTIYPLRDTCGCSFHWDPMIAIFGSLKEQLERQFLTKFWLTKKCRTIVPINIAIAKLNNAHSAKLYQHLALAGDTTVIDISDPRFPGACVLIVYGSAADNRHVKYCAGMAYTASFEEALDKSIRELWQTFRFIDLFCATNSEHKEIEDPYLKYFLSCNNYRTYQEITTTLQSHEKVPHHKERFDAPGLLKTLETQGINGFIYIKPIAIENSNYFASKYLSPDLFLHMNSSQNINIRNRYSDSFFHEVDDTRKKFMVPFP
ncbi:MULTISPECIES: YcaO-like family protein [unclassified Pseudomonas]|uniref:YcaO-like family protein n=1 Tax=unclassified Pseudomonas TaxID=196821 RepID=UPI001C456BEC|nr:MULTISPECIES: YcaO-like family protein [unclassified Pseudomonas]MBV7509914.1 YcaO-like family protein [Pseudomonas sp. PDM25]